MLLDRPFYYYNYVSSAGACPISKPITAWHSITLASLVLSVSCLVIQSLNTLNSSSMLMTIVVVIR